MSLNELTDEQLSKQHAVALKQYNLAYKQKKDIEDEIIRRFNNETESK